MISRQIYEDAKESFLSIQLIQYYLPTYNLNEVKEIICC